MRRTLFSLAALATLALAACNGSPTDTVPGDARFDGMIGSGVGRSQDAGTIGSGMGRADGDTTSRGGGGTIGSGT